MSTRPSFSKLSLILAVLGGCAPAGVDPPGTGPGGDTDGGTMRDVPATPLDQGSMMVTDTGGTMMGSFRTDGGGVYVSAGSASACARRPDGTVRCWGNNRGALLGDGTMITRAEPVPVMGITDATEVSVGQFHSCAVRANGHVMCWGTGRNGQLGNGNNIDSATPVEVVQLDDAVHVAVGQTFTCAVRRAGPVVCWGQNDRGQVGDSTRSERTRPTTVSGADDVVAIAAGLAHACAVRMNGGVLCWGDNANGQLGNGVGGAGMAADTPVTVSGLVDAVGVAAGLNHACALKQDGSAVCWGSNSAGQLGDGSTTVHNTPTAVMGIAGATALAGGGRTTCARLRTGAVQCWGAGASGQLGNGATQDHPTPVAVSNLPDAIQVAVGADFACAVRGSGEVVCWGSDMNRQLGRGGENTVTGAAALGAARVIGYDPIPGPGGPTDGGVLPDVPTMGTGMVRGTWTAMRTGATETLTGLWGPNASSVIAVGVQTIARWNGTAWSVTASPLALRGISGTSATSAWVSGITVPTNGSGKRGLGVFLRWNGTAFAQSMPLTALNLSAVWARADNDVFAVGETAAAHWNGTAWTNISMGIPAGVELYSVWGSSASDVRAVGVGVYRYTGSGWAAETAAGTGSYLGIWGSGANDVWIVGPSAARHFNGTAWSTVLTGTLSRLNGIWGAAANDVWAVGDGGVLVHYDGARWSTITSPTTATLRAVWGSAANDVWAVGDNGVAIHYRY